MEDESKPTLQYQIAPSPVTRGQIRLLLLLMLIQVVMTAQATYAPGVVGWVKNAWAEHQQAVAHRAQVKKNLAAQQKCLAYVQPAKKVVWEEDPERAAKLLAGGGYQPIVPSGQASDFFSDAVPPGASADMPKTLLASVPEGLNLFGMVNNTLIFMHGRRAAGQPERLVAVGIHSDVRTTERNQTHQTTDTFDGTVWKWQTLVARSFGTDSEDGTPAWDAPSTTTLRLQQENEAAQLPAHWAAATQPGNPGQLTVQYSDQLRLYAGQIDPADPSHFTIAYDLDGQTSVIDGWLKADGSVVLQPKLGKVANTVWYPHAK
jgi:hypothetical protein